MRSLAFTLVCLLFSLVGPSAHAANVPTTKVPSTEDLFRRADSHYERLTTLQFKVERTLERGLQAQEERWEVSLRKPDAIRVEYEGPPRRIILSRGEQYSEYIPQAKKALELDTTRLTAKARQEMIDALMPRVAIPGFRLGISPEMRERMAFDAPRLEERDGRASYFIQGKEKKPAKDREPGMMKIWLDRERYTLQRLEMYEGTRFVSSIETAAFVEFEPGFWLPSRVTVRNSTPAALEKATYRIAHLRANGGFAPTLFDANYEAGTKITRPER